MNANAKIEKMIAEKTEISIQSKKFQRQIRRAIITDYIEDSEAGLFILKFSRIRKDRWRGFTYTESKQHSEIYTDFDKLAKAVIWQGRQPLRHP